MHQTQLLREPSSQTEAWWPSLSLVRQFTLVGAALVLVGLCLIGVWTASKIKEGIAAHSAGRTALYMEGFVTPHLQELASNRWLSEENALIMDRLLANDASRIGIVTARIWASDGVLLYTTTKEQVGLVYPMPAPLLKAWDGFIEVEFSPESRGQTLGTSAVSATERGPLLEIYVPIRHSTTHQIIAVAQFSEVAAELKRKQQEAFLDGMIVAALTGLAAMGGLYIIVASGNRTIETQRISLAGRIAELSELLRQNEELRERVQNASRLSAENAELLLRRLGSDLHDGPAQLLALALLKLDGLFDGSDEGDADRENIRSVLNDAMTEIRNISAGLALPEIDKLSLAQALIVVASEHERRTGTRVSCELPTVPLEVTQPTKLCLCRVVQEGLSNSFKHAAGMGQKVTASWSESVIVVDVWDAGAGVDFLPKAGKRPALGLVGLRNRLESLGGRLTVKINKGGTGAHLTASLPVGEGG